MEALIATSELEDKGHPRRPSFNESGRLLAIGAMPANALKASKFVKVAERWGEVNGIEVAGLTTQEFSIVPKNFDGCLIPVTRQSCNRCHVDAGEHVREFDAFGNQLRNDSGVVGRRHWYGVVRGNDKILSWHPFAESTISTNGGNNKVVFRKGDIVLFDPRQYNKAEYPGMK
jgi:hypothetical protein